MKSLVTFFYLVTAMTSVAANAGNCQKLDTMKIRISGGYISAMTVTVNGEKAQLEPIRYLDPSSQNIYNGYQTSICRDKTATYAVVLWGEGKPAGEILFGNSVDGDPDGNRYHRFSFNLDRGVDTTGDVPVSGL